LKVFESAPEKKIVATLVERV